MAKVIPFKKEEEPSFGLVLKFIDESPSFTYGFECGKIWNLLTMGFEVLDLMVNAANREQIELIAESQGKKAYFDEIAEGWLNVTIA